jgi:hypothetical protein
MRKNYRSGEDIVDDLSDEFINEEYNAMMTT